MLTIGLVIAVYLFATAAARGGSIRMTERGSSALVWLEHHPRAGTSRSRAALAHRSKRRLWRGLRLSGTAWLNRRRDDVDTASPFGCLHLHEGAWTSNTGNGYWGGLQMDSGFFHTYGAEYVALWGTPDRWPIWAQVVAGFRAYHGYHGYGPRGYSPWGTRGLCGL